MHLYFKYGYDSSFSGFPNSSMAIDGENGGLKPNSHRISLENDESTNLYLLSLLPKPFFNADGS